MKKIMLMFVAITKPEKDHDMNDDDGTDENDDGDDGAEDD